MTVSSTTNTTNTTGTISGNQLAVIKGGNLQNTFTQLLVTQLKNQDPLDLVDSSQMTSQLTQINTVNGIQQLNTMMLSMFTQNVTAQTSSTIGHSVQVPISNLALTSGAANFGVSVPNGVDDVVITVTNAASIAVRIVDLDQTGGGSDSYIWNSRGGRGNQLADGAYSIEVSVTQSGKVITVNALGTGKVTGVTINNSTTQLVPASDGAVELSDVASIR